MKDLFQIDGENIDYSVLRNKHILITGSTGLIGSCTARLLLYLNKLYSLNLKLILLVRSVEKAISFFGKEPCVEYYCQDVIQPIVSDVGHIDYYILAACNAYPKAYKETPADVMNANYLGVYNAFDHIVRNNFKETKVLFVSSSEVYGEYECGDSGVSEDFEGTINHFMTRSCYTESKRAAETLCLSYASQYGIDVSIARPGYIFGPTRLTKNNRADVEFFSCVIEDKPIVLRSPGLQRRSYCFVEDAALALIFILLKGLDREAYNIALNPEDSISIAEFASLIAKVGKVDLIKAFEPIDAGWSPFSKAILNNSKLKELGWNAHYSVLEGIQKTIMQMKELI